MQSGIPALRRAGGGAIVNTASFVAVLGAATPQVAYTAARARCWRSPASSRSCTRARTSASTRCPGPLKTEMLMKFLDDEKKQRRLVHIPIGRFGEAKKSRAALFLVSDDASYDGDGVSRRRRHYGCLCDAGMSEAIAG